MKALRVGMGMVGVAVLAFGSVAACGGSDSGSKGGGGGGGAGASDGGGATGGGGTTGTGATGATGGGGTGGTAAGECKTAADCVAKLPSTTPPNCAEAECDTVLGKCVFKAKDADGDGHTGAKCAANGGGALQLGDDCDDNDKNTYPGSWDGPVDPSDPNKPERCDNVDQDCDGNTDDEKVGGKGCACDPGNPPSCIEAETGGAIPGLDDSTAGQGICVYGKRECVNGNPGKCVGAVGPKTEICNKADDDCNGVVDDNVSGAPSWMKDLDNDNFGDKAVQPVKACDAPGIGWKQGIPNTDCNDADQSINPSASDSPTCDGKDHDCDGTPNTGCSCKTGDKMTCYASDPNACNKVEIVCANGSWPACPAAVPKAEWCQDSDGDGFCTTSCQLACAQPATGWKSGCAKTDCNDAVATVNPAGTEVCNEKDDDCDGAIDDNGVPQTETCNNIDDNCNGKKDEPFGALKYTPTYNELSQYHGGCTSGGAWKVYCQSAAKRYCETKKPAGACQISGAFLCNGGTPQAICFADAYGDALSTDATTIKNATGYDLTNPSTDFGQAALYAAHGFCKQQGYAAGIGPVEIALPAVNVLCLKAEVAVEVAWTPGAGELQCEPSPSALNAQMACGCMFPSWLDPITFCASKGVTGAIGVFGPVWPVAGGSYNVLCLKPPPQ